MGELENTPHFTPKGPVYMDENCRQYAGTNPLCTRLHDDPAKCRLEMQGVRWPIHSSDIFTFQQLLNSKSPMWPCIVIHKNEVCASGTSEQTHMGKKYLLTIAIPDYRPSMENVELSSPVQHNASPDKNSRTTVMVPFLDVTGIKPCPVLSPNQNALRNRFWKRTDSHP
ncbi:uncharacterized protein TNCV_3240761 [Trichonephila clavipes]|nr:uncharacterized protein TNCV_3240761 [Trichonephila clavipes]